ncbi:uncharacterized protein TNCV_4338021 [Trichonephila clavipes]|uniref:Uncharacterized protein n=1 Tax=Trichonephila clavipes TaxID=2585209 RepID=A0A8X6SR82_TRICX|nr:uncharacterized protein TNCV_4338021 [Trichonephila clavipes]
MAIMSLTVALGTIQMAKRFSSVSRQFCWRTHQGPPTSFPRPPTSREDLRLDGYLKYLHTAKALYFYKHQCLRQDSNPGPTAQQSASLTTIPDGRLIPT